MNSINVTYNSIQHSVLMLNSTIYTDETTGFLSTRPIAGQIS
jgi:hypothetical protein